MELRSITEPGQVFIANPPVWRETRFPKHDGPVRVVSTDTVSGVFVQVLAPDLELVTMTLRYFPLERVARSASPTSGYNLWYQAGRQGVTDPRQTVRGTGDGLEDLLNLRTHEVRYINDDLDYGIYAIRDVSDLPLKKVRGIPAIVEVQLQLLGVRPNAPVDWQETG